MKIKRYIASDSQEAMIKIKAELGLDAVILHSRKIKKPGIMGIFQKPLVEVVAAIEEKEDNRSSKIIHNNLKVNTRAENDRLEEIQNQIDTMQDLLLNFMNKNEKLEEGKNSSIYDKYYNLLIDNDIDQQIASKILNIAKKQIAFTYDNEDAVKKTIKIIMKEYLGPPNPINQDNKQQKSIVFVGPTGVGKTTTLAKLAAMLSIGSSKSVGLITADTYRIAAVEQLRTYSEILGVPLKVIYEPSEIKDAIHNYKDKDILLIDTAGRNHRLDEQLEEIKSLINHIPSSVIYLLISATTSNNDIKSIIKSYGFLQDYNLIFTKVDESTSVGNILNTKVFTGKDIAYITTGQIVPDDIEVANPEKIASLIVGE